MTEKKRFPIRRLLLTSILFCFLLGCMVTVSAKDARSDYSASKLYSYKGHTYQLVYSKMLWTKANRYAKKLGGHLAVITTAGEQSFIETCIRENASSYTSHYWVGASDTNYDGTWKWVTGEKFKYSNWASGVPDNYLNSQPYMAIFGTSEVSYKVCRWDDQAYYDENGFIIEWEALTVEDKQLEFDVGDTAFINYSTRGSGTVSFKSSDTSVAKVSSKGKVIAKGAGVCKITIKYKKDSQKVTLVVYPKKVTGLKKLSATAKMAQLKWKAQSGADGYQVWMYDPDVEEYVKVKTTSQTSATVKGLDRNTTYKFKVRAYVKYGKKYYYGPYSKAITVKTKK